MCKRILSLTVIICFFLTTLGPCPLAHADTVLGLPTPGTMVNVTPAFEPALIKGVIVHPENPFIFDFIVASGASGLKGEALRSEVKKMVKYFLTALTVPEEDLWVNLSPYEKDRMFSKNIGQTEMGRDLLAQDYILKQLTATLLYPEQDLGKKFWERVYEKTQKLYHTTDISIDTFNKVWIVPQKAVVYEHNGGAFVAESHLKVMLEEDFLALNKNLGKEKLDISKPDNSQAKTYSKLTTNIIREVVIPEIEKEVNEGQNFASLRQIVNTVILASWYKDHLKESLLSKVYVNENKVKGIDLKDKTINQNIYNQYLKAYKKGVYNYIKEEVNPITQETMPRKYFSGGTLLDESKVRKDVKKIDSSLLAKMGEGENIDFRFGLESIGAKPVVQESDLNQLNNIDNDPGYIAYSLKTMRSEARKELFQSPELGLTGMPVGQEEQALKTAFNIFQKVSKENGYIETKLPFALHKLEVVKAIAGDQGVMDRVNWPVMFSAILGDQAMLVSGQTLEGQLLAKAAQFDAAMVAKDKNAAKETYFFDSIKNTYAGFIERSHHIANHILVSFHAAFISSLLSLPAGGVQNWSQALQFLFASPETFISLAFLWLSWHSNIAIHEMGHYIKAVQLDALSAKLLPQAKQELAEANKGPINKALYLIKMFFKTPYGKQPGIIKNGLNYYVDAPYNLSVAAAGPLTSLKYAAIPGLTMMAIMITAGLSTGMNDLVYAGRAFLGIGAVGLLDYFLTDPGAKKAYRAQMKQQQENAEQVAQKSQTTGAWIDQLPEIKNKLVNTRPQEVQVTVNGVTERLRAPWQYRNSGMGGKHTEAEFPKSNISFQETMFLPLKYADYGEFQEMTVKCQKTLKDLIEGSENGQVMGIGLEGGVVPYLDRKWHDKDGDHEVPVPDLRLWLLAKQAIIKSGFVPGVDVGIALDPAVSELENAYREETGKEDAVGMYMFWRDKEKIVMTTDELLQLFHDAIFKYDIPIVSIEDGMAEDDYRGWKLLNEKFGKYMPIIADDVATTNDKTVDTLAEEGLANSLLVKFNQIGSLSEGILAVLNALGKGWTIVSSHRSKSPNDDMEAQVGMGFNAMGVKMGGGNNTERLFKYSAVMAVMTKAIADAKEHFKNKIEADSVFKKSSEEFIKNMQITKILAVEKPTNAGIPTVGVQVFFSIPGLDGLNYTFEGATPLGTSAGTGEAIHLTDDIIYPAQVPQGVESDQLFDKTKDGSLRFKKSIKQNDIDAIKNPALSELFRRSKRYNGKGNLNAVDNVLNIVSKFFVGKKLSEIGSIQSIDTELLKMEEDLARERGLLSANASDEERIAIMQRKGQIGMNALLSSSLALSRLVAAMQGKDLWQLIREQAKDIIARTIEHNGGLSILPDELSAKVQVADGQSLSDALVHSLSLDELVVGLQAVDKNRAPNVRLYQLLRQEMNVYRVDYSKTPVRPDSAMFSRGVKNRIAAIKTKDVGGIYINPKMFDMQIKKDNNGVPLPVAQQPMMKMNVDGFIPVFIYDHPFNGLSTFLGLTAAASKEPEELAKV